MSPNAKRDENRVPTLLATTMESPYTNVVVLWADPDTHRLLVNATISGTVATTSSPSQNTKIDDTTTPGVIYIGNAEIGSVGSDATWQIKKLDTNTLALDKTWADGNDNADNVWDDRASLSYS